MATLVRNGEKMNLSALVAAVVISIFIGWIIRRCLIDSMTNVHIAREATDYLERESVNITTVIDTYLFTNLAVIPKNDDDDDDKKVGDADDTDVETADEIDDDVDSDDDSDGGDGGDGGGD